MGRQWMARDCWDALVRGEGCPLCAELASSEDANDEGYFIADLSFSRLRLAKYQAVAGYCVLICRRHVREPYELTPEEQALYFADLARVGKTLEHTFGAIKMNFELLGNAVPHLHCHIKPRYYGDPAPGMPIWPDQFPSMLTPEQCRERVAVIGAALAAR